MGLINGVSEKNLKINNMSDNNREFYQRAKQIREQRYNNVSITDASELRRKTDEEIRLDVLVNENERLRNQYSDSVKKITILLEAYKKLEIENEALKSKLGKRESVTKTVENSKNYLKNIYDNFINWLNS